MLDTTPVTREFTTVLRTRFDEFVEEVGFTPREAEICRLILKGLSQTDISRVLGITLSSVKSHSTTVYSKAGCVNRAELGHLIFPL